MKKINEIINCYATIQNVESRTIFDSTIEVIKSCTAESSIYNSLIAELIGVRACFDVEAVEDIITISVYDTDKAINSDIGISIIYNIAIDYKLREFRSINLAHFISHYSNDIVDIDTDIFEQDVIFCATADEKKFIDTVICASKFKGLYSYCYEIDMHKFDFNHFLGADNIAISVSC